MNNLMINKRVRGEESASVPVLSEAESIKEIVDDLVHSKECGLKISVQREKVQTLDGEKLKVSIFRDSRSTFNKYGRVEELSLTWEVAAKVAQEIGL